MGRLVRVRLVLLRRGARGPARGSRPSRGTRPWPSSSPSPNWADLLKLLQGQGHFFGGALSNSLEYFILKSCEQIIVNLLKLF